ncbi:hypothetical protein A7E78_00325 [Syntrophotalea acetylenivorans]|uniref:BioF2-like acetyltransferase domain-containing protein n=1 Tax=Syntrophotalea acetylenivorans TaxID=1842532 RepID=A0A1L3GKN5_9BACT|nr:GNAT family N-acetyltransferase [Syntrophotalea acetylenivorans]APG26445.1 hypothetical protein A7E78_00325 [Syntrophotalea acetylenivorans]
MSKLSENEKVVARIITNELEWDAIRSAWNGLFERSPNASPPLHFDWLRRWWRTYGHVYADGLLIFTLWRETKLICGVPLYVSRGKFGVRCIRFISTGEEEYEEICPDYLNILALPGEEEVSAAAFWREIAGLGWDQIEFQDLPKDSPLFPNYNDMFDAQPYFRGGCPIANISGGFDAYLGRLSSHRRNKARRLLRDGKRAGVKFEIVEHCRADQVFDALIRLHQERWVANGKPGVFSAPRFVEFHRNLIHDWMPEGKALLAQLLINDEPIAVLYGFVSGSKFDFYQCGIRRDPTISLRSPGNLANLLFIKALSEMGISEYDFLRGSSAYKNELATCENQLFGLRIWRLTPRSMVHRFMGLSCGAVRKGLSLFGIY